MPAADVLVVSVDSTTGWRAAAAELAALARAGGRARRARRHAGRSPQVRTFALTDLARGARARGAACERGIDEHDPAAIIYCSITAALLWPRPGAIWLDSLAAENRPGRHGLWQRLVERRRLAQSPLVLDDEPGRARRSCRRRPRRRCVVPGPGRPLGPARPAAATSTRSRTPATPRRSGSTTCCDAWDARAPRGRDARGGRARAARRRARGVRARRAARARRVPRAASPRARVRRGAAPRGLRDRAARGARRRLPARDDAGAGAVPGARDRPRGSTRGWSVDDLVPARSGPRSTTRSPATPSAPPSCSAPFSRDDGRSQRSRNAFCHDCWPA